MASRASGCGDWIRTSDLQIMGLTSYLCSTPLYVPNRYSKRDPAWVSFLQAGLVTMEVLKCVLSVFSIAGIHLMAHSAIKDAHWY